MPYPLKALCAAVLAAAGIGSAAAADQSLNSPAYVGADIGAVINKGDGITGRAYAGYNLGSGLLFDRVQVHSIELMVYSVGAQGHQYRPPYYYVDEKVRGDGVAINWATALKVDDKWSLNTRLGIDNTWVTTTAGTARQTRDKAGWLAGVGVSYKLAPQLSLTADLSYMPIKLDRWSKTNSAVLSTGLRYGF